MLIHPSQNPLRRGVALLRSFAKPPGGFGVVLTYALAISICPAKVVLGLHIALVCGPTEPLRRFGVLLFHPLTVAIHHAQVILPVRVAALGCLPDAPCG